MSQTSQQKAHFDVVVVGGGVAGLWLMNALRSRGYDCLLLERDQLGGDQSVASQGMIHGGMKYTLSGGFSGASESIADMPAYWSRCLAGEGDVDLRGAGVLSRNFYFWSSESVTSRLSTFFASKAVKGRMQRVKRKDYPALLQNESFSGQVYQLQDIVLDVPSVLTTLAERLPGRVFSLQGCDYQWRRTTDNQAEVIIRRGAESLAIGARQFVFTAGKGNGELMAALDIEQPRMQLRPVHQVWVKHHLPYDFYGHCLGADKTPRLSISTHPAADGGKVWSLGGSIAEVGVQQSEEEVIASAQREVRELLPWVDLSDARWMAQKVARAEARQRNFLRPDKAYAKTADGIGNVIVGWPTKLTLAPNLATEVIDCLQEQGVAPSGREQAPAIELLDRAKVAAPPWDKVFGTGEETR